MNKSDYVKAKLLHGRGNDQHKDATYRTGEMLAHHVFGKGCCCKELIQLNSKANDLI